MVLNSGNKLALFKLKLMYILSVIDLPLTNTEITKLILERNYMDYFTLQQILSELCNSHFVELSSKNGNEYYYLADAGKATLEMFNDKLPNSFRAEVNNIYTKLKKSLKKQREVLGHYYERSKNEFIVYLQVMENDTVIFSMSINVPTKQQAELICNKWNSNPDEIYGSIIELLVSDSK